MERFKDDPFFQHDNEPTTTTQKRAETFVNESEDAFYSFRDKILKNLTNVFNSKIRYFPANVLMIQAMYRLMRPGGVLEQEGFHGYGYKLFLYSLNFTLFFAQAHLHFFG